jgi:hypothetical protein
MHPLTVVTGILLGSAVSIAVGLAVVMLIFFLLAAEHPQLGAEIGALVTNTVIFLALTAICAASFISLVKEFRWWWIAQLGMWATLGVIVFYYIP